MTDTSKSIENIDETTHASSPETESVKADLAPLPDRAGVEGLEEKWTRRWEEEGTYQYQGSQGCLFY